MVIIIFMEKSTSYKTIIAISALLLLALFTYSFSAIDIAFADDFSLEFPINNYVQIKSVDSISANENCVALLDNTDKKLLFVGENIHSYTFDNITPKNVYIIGDTALIQFEEGYQKIDLNTFSDPEDVSLPTGISYLTTYSEYVYAHSFGSVTKYDQSLNIVATYNDSCFSNMPIMVSNGEDIFLYSVEYGVSKYTVFNTSTSNSSKSNASFNAVSASMGNFIFINDGASIKAVGTTDGQIAFDTQIQSSAFFAYGDKLYVANGTNGYAVYTIDGTNETATLVSQFAMTGNGLDKLCAPTAVNYDGNRFIVADSGNNRVLFASDTSYSINLNGVKNIAVGNSKVYASTEKTVSIISNGEITSTFECSENVVDLAYGNSLLVLGESRLFALIGGKLETICEIANGKALASAQGGDLIYILTADKLSTYNSNGEKVLFDVEVSGIDLAVDYAGNAFILNENGTVSFVDMKKTAERIISSTAVNSDVISLENDDLISTPNSMCFFDGKLYFSTEENAIVSIEKGISERQFSPSPQIAETNLKAGLVNADTIAFSEPNKYDTATIIPAGTDIIAFDQTSTLSGYIQGVYRGKCVYIYDNGISFDKQNTEINQVYRATENLRAYNYPDGNYFVNIERSQLVTVYDDAFGIDNDKWYRIKIDDKCYFVLRNQVEE